jgi:hypothetical protein
MRISKQVLFMLCAVTFITAFTGCQEDKVPSGSYRVEIEDVFEISDFVVKKLEFTTLGTRRIHIQLSPGNRDMATFSPEKGNKYAKATVLIVAEKITIDNRSFVLLRWPITTKNSTLSGRSAPIELLQPGELSEEFDLTLESGIYPIDQQTDLARIHDRTYSILID